MVEHTHRILVVDDNEMNRDMLSRRLQRKGYEVATAEDGTAALDAVAAESFDLVLLDIMMPGIDGFEVLERIRTARSPTDLPIVMATAKDQRDDIVKALRLGANDYVTKPLDFPVVLARVQTQLALKHSVDQIVALEQDLQRRNAELEEANRRMKRDLEAAARVQQALLPTKPPDHNGTHFAWFYQPCDELGGDILNVFELDDDHVVMYLLDVSGHGVQAALLSVTLSRVLSPVAEQATIVQRAAPETGRLEPTPPAEVVGELNRRFPVDLETGQYFTLYYSLLNTRTHELRSVCAGHPGPVLVRANGQTEVVKKPCFPVGWVPDAVYEETRLLLRPGDRLYVYSDGISEVMNATREQFGDARVVELLEGGRAMELAESVRGLIASAGSWGCGDFGDDISALAVEISQAATTRRG